MRSLPETVWAGLFSVPFSQAGCGLSGRNIDPCRYDIGRVLIGADGDAVLSVCGCGGMEYPVESCIWKLSGSGSMADRYAYSRGIDVEEKMPRDAVGRYY